jgi:molybdopterin-containing oxidoreductase family iron-sulfur binding subunit
MTLHHPLERHRTCEGEAAQDFCVSRRRFLHWVSTSLALGGLVGCGRSQPESIVPYVRQPENLVPGKPLYYATSIPVSGIAQGVLVECHMGRPTRIDGNPTHPSSPRPVEDYEAPPLWGAAGIQAQAAVLDLYDPDRSKSIQHQGGIETWDSFLDWVSSMSGELDQRGGRGFRLLTGTLTSPTQLSLINELMERYPNAKWHSHPSLSEDARQLASEQAFGQRVDTLHHFDRADLVVAIESDFLTSGPSAIRDAHAFMTRRRDSIEDGKMNRLYSIESGFTPTGAVADHRLPLKPSLIESFTWALARRIGVEIEAADETGLDEYFLKAVATDLKAHSGRSLVLAGGCASTTTQTLVHAMNQALGNDGTAVEYIEPVTGNETSNLQSLRNLIVDMNSGEVEWLVLLDTNPLYDTPADSGFAEAFEKISHRVHLGLYHNETAVRSHWHLPMAHPLESWGDLKAFDGTVSLLQPTIAPLYGGVTATQVLETLLNRPSRSTLDSLQAYWREHREPGPEGFESFWNRALHEGAIEGTRHATQRVRLQPLNLPPPQATAEGEGLEVAFRPDPSLLEGSQANNGWLQELPKPITHLTWGNAALLSPATAERLGVTTGDEAILTLHERTVEAPVFVLPGHSEDCVTLHLGHGRWKGGANCEGVGFNAARIRSASAPCNDTGLTLTPTGKKTELATTQHHHRMEGRDLVHVRTLDAHQGRLESPSEEEPLAQLYDPFDYPEEAWGMNIDLTRCVGCNACVIACQSENSIPVVGQEEVLRGREMHWIRIDSYIEDHPQSPKAHFQPVTCMHCEDAPCETVCPVGATQHSRDGLNEMIYNRCIGTRYCSNNCPYKVRRFNFLQYADTETESLKLQRNPDVTVRSRGVMEKCTYCVQRISQARIEAGKENRPIRDGEIVTACQAACPTETIVFGDLNKKASAVSRRASREEKYELLRELGTFPRTTYLAKIVHPNHDLKEPEDDR